MGFGPKVTHERGIVLLDALDKKYPILFVNNAFLRLFKYKREDVLGRHIRLLFGEKTDRDTVRGVFNALENGERIEFDLLAYTRDKSEIQIQMDLIPVFRGKETPRSFVATICIPGESYPNFTPRRD